MPNLQLPTPEVRESFLAAMVEFADERRGASDDHTMIGHEIRTFGGTWHTAAGFAAFVRSLRADALEETPRPEGWVPCTTWWWVGSEGYIGRIALRHRLTEYLLREGGHIGTTSDRPPAVVATRPPCFAPPFPRLQPAVFPRR